MSTLLLSPQIFGGSLSSFPHALVLLCQAVNIYVFQSLFRNHFLQAHFLPFSELLLVCNEEHCSPDAVTSCLLGSGGRGKEKDLVLSPSLAVCKHQGAGNSFPSRHLKFLTL